MARGAEEIWDELWHQEAHHSTALEGNTLVLNEVRKLLDEGRTVGAKELKEYMEALGYGAAAKWVYGQALEPGDWTTGDLLSIQEVHTSTTRRLRLSGKWRRTSTRPLRRRPAAGGSTTSELSRTG